MQPEEPEELVIAMERATAALRERPRHSTWYMLIPEWVVDQGGGWDVFTTRFTVSVRRNGLGGLGVVGFEVPAGDGYRRYTLPEYEDAA